jgi:general secretion pathway protein D
MTFGRSIAAMLACGLAGVSPVALGTAWAQAAPAAPPSEAGVTLREVDIRAFIEDVSSATGRTLIIDPRVTGKVTVVAQQTLNERELWDVFQATLRVSGFVAVPTARGAYRIVPDSVAAREPAASSSGENTYVTQVFSLQFADAESVLNALRPMLSERGQISATRRGNALVVVDYGSTVARLREVIARLDRDSSQTRTISLRNTSAAEMARVAVSLSQGVGDDAASRSLVQAVPVSSSNSLLLRGEQGAIERIAATIEQLDQSADVRAGVQVISLRYAVADELVPVLTSLSAAMGQVAGAEGQGAGPQPGRRANIAAHRATNSLIISADPETQEALSRVVRTLDVRRQQVLVEAIIVEVSDTAAQELGLQFLLANPDGSNAVPFLSTNFSQSAPNLLAVTGALLINEGDEPSTALTDLQRAAVQSLIGSRGALGGIGGQRSDGSILGLILNALAEDRQSNVLSTPSVMTLDNETASILVGQQIPITTGEALSDNFDNQFRTVRREDVGVRLEVRPQISEGGAIRLQIKQEVSSVFGPVVQGSADLITNRREITTAVQVDAGQVVVLGGLIQEDVQRGTAGVPGLRNLPVAGRLFRTDSESRRRTNLMVFLRPTIVSTSEQAAAVTQQQLRALRGYDGVDPNTLQRVDQFLTPQGPVTPTPAPAPR